MRPAVNQRVTIHHFDSRYKNLKSKREASRMEAERAVPPIAFRGEDGEQA